VGSKEFTDALVGSMPLAIGVVFAATFVLLGIAFRSIIIPIKSILMNTLTVGAAYGVITLIFQKGFLAGALNVPTDVGAIDSSLPLVMFAVTFGLSMDYEIFLLSRVQEAHLQGMSVRESVKAALERTAGVITSAALIMLIVFAAFVQGDVVANKTIGLGLAVAVLLDATLIRLVLVPAVLVLAGEWNWWLPKGLKRALPKVSLEH
jgi:RND superfamily putative drug exporter